MRHSPFWEKSEEFERELRDFDAGLHYMECIEVFVDAFVPVVRLLPEL